MTTSRLRRLGALTTLVAGALAIAGCSSAESGAAAVVGDQRISVASVQSGYDSLVKLAGPDAGFTQPIVLDYLILEPYLSHEASSLGRAVSIQDAELQANIDTTRVKPTPAALKVIRALAANTAIRSGRTQEQVDASYQKVSDQLKAAGVHVNPRYGSGIDYEINTDTTLSILPSKQDWIASTPAAAATPTAPSNTGGSEPTPTP